MYFRFAIIVLVAYATFKSIASEPGFVKLSMVFIGRGRKLQLQGLIRIPQHYKIKIGVHCSEY
jgi:hypothetical protein